MCQYSATDGLPDDWHLVHLGQFAAGGAGLVMTEASAVVPEGRISPQDAGIWNDAQVAAWRRIVDFLHARGATAAMQLAHAGRKASTVRPWEGTGSVAPDDGGWTPVAPSAQPFADYTEPHALAADEVAALPGAFAAGARRALRAGFDVVELHFAHGYLLHQFLSPLSNHRDDAYGGSFENRIRLAVEIVEAVRAEVGDDVPVLTRISATDWTEGGWDADDSVALARALARAGADLVDTSSGGNVPHTDIPVGPRRRCPAAPSGSSPTRRRPRRSSRRGRPTSCCSPAPSCATRTGRCAPPTSSASTTPRRGPSSTPGRPGGRDLSRVVARTSQRAPSDRPTATGYD
jgi:2,4-dienoyl-CoA reductase-like NADH-dependent reductase (Old Yellow Enzyme family)